MSKSESELAAEGEIRLGEARGGSTIINEAMEEEGIIANRMALSELAGQRVSQQPLAEKDGSSGGDQDQTVFDLIAATIQNFIPSLFSPVDPTNIRSESKSLTNSKIDELALFPGNSYEAYLKEMKISPGEGEKLLEMKDFLDDDDFVEWERRCRQIMPHSTLHSPIIKQLESYRARLRAYLGSWDKSLKHSSPNIYLLDDQLTAHRIPSLNKTDAIRGKIGFSNGIHAWDIKILGPIGSHCSVGIASKEAPLIRSGYTSLVGDDDFSFGWDIVRGKLIHKGTSFGNYPNKYIYDYTPGDIVRIILDCDRNILSYAVNEMSFGAAFKTVPKGITFFPSISFVYGNVEASLIYLGHPPPCRNDGQTQK